ncbi:hypothetical protein DPMN_145935 [Dreissena polymorpha]|uniref:Uncharacterized protein n=1 Tax=Dreissena polymorpha TaxID=45954 RepID=A0A9D4J1M7_DREPO|nr:hypothetical protein DPMN_145935 [Dreissena polymorpha]
MSGGWCSSDVRVLIAGDSNVHRLKSACPPNTRIDFLPVSGAKYVSDRKGFRKLLHQELIQVVTTYCTCILALTMFAARIAISTVV